MSLLSVDMIRGRPYSYEHDSMISYEFPYDFNKKNFIVQALYNYI